MDYSNLIYIIDPQSINSLAAYDHGMIGEITDLKFHFFGNEAYNDKPFERNVTFFPIFRYNKYKNPIFKGISYILSLLIIVLHGLKDRPAVIHIQWIRLWPVDWAFIRFFKNFLKCKFVFTVHNLLPRNRNKDTFERYNSLYHFSDLLISHTETTKKDLKKHFNIPSPRIVVMPHGIIEMKISEKELQDSTNKLEETYHLRDKIVIGALGVQSPYKGTDLLLSAWIETPFLAKNDNAILLIAGKPSGIKIPNELPHNVIVIPQLLSNPDFKAIMRRTDVMALPYREIEQSGVLLSLIQEEKPYVCTMVGELSRPLEMADIGWVFENVSSEEISRTICDILHKPEQIYTKKNNSAGWAILKEEYSWRKSNVILKRAYNSLLN